MRVTVVPALADNYIHIAEEEGGGRAIVADPGEAAPAIAFLKNANAAAEAVLITHMHSDHTAGLGELRRAFPAAVVYAPANSGIAGAIGVGEGDCFSVFDGAISFRVLETPGHTAEHISFFANGGGNGNNAGGDDSNRALFCGDTLFCGGCGRLLGGTAKQMRLSLEKLQTLPGETKIYCGHEYTENNLKFALAAEPDNAELRARIKTVAALRAKGMPTVPSAMAAEKATNPFLRLREETIIAAAQKQLNRPPRDPDETFAALRKWKDNF